METSAVFDLYRQLAPVELFRLLQRQMRVNVHDGIYSARLVIWMMMQQRLRPGGRWPAAWNSWRKVSSMPY